MTIWSLKVAQKYYKLIGFIEVLLTIKIRMNIQQQNISPKKSNNLSTVVVQNTDPVNPDSCKKMYINFKTGSSF